VNHSPFLRDLRLIESRRNGFDLSVDLNSPDNFRTRRSHVAAREH
jgi:hypothetical protein